MIDWITGLLQQNAVASGGLVVLLTGAVLAAARSLPMRLWQFARNRLILRIEVADSDPAYQWLERWWAAKQSDRRTRSLTLVTRHRGEGFEQTKGWDICLAPGPGEHFLRYQGAFLWMSMDREKVQMSSGGRNFYQTMNVRMFGGQRALLEQLVEEARAAYDANTDGRTRVYVPAWDGQWTTACIKPKRSIDSLVFADNLSDDLVEDLTRFRERKAWYQERGIPWRRGYLLHGPPGSGKTSLCLAAAGHLSMDVALLPLGSSSLNDDQLQRLFYGTPANTVIVVEDIDAVFEGRERKAENKLTFSGLLNVLDGIGSIDGRVVFLTTNRPEALDPALIRQGRCDRHLLVGPVTPEQARQYFLRFFPGETDAARDFATHLNPDTSMAEIQEHLLQTEDSVEDARKFRRLKVAV